MSFASTAQPFVCGGTAACLASAVVHPIDLAKVRLQVNYQTYFLGFINLHISFILQLYATSELAVGAAKPNFVSVLTGMVKNEGVGSIYAGLSAALMRQMIYGTARIGLHRTFSDMLIERNGGKPISFGMKTLSGMLSGSIAVCIGTPFDVTLVRMQGDSMKPVEKRRGYKNVFDALIRVSREEGFSTLYSGLLPNILRGMSMNVGMMACYDQVSCYINILMMFIIWLLY
jgi:solute carrier family 25 oxoglutarate transporter 11